MDKDAKLKIEYMPIDKLKPYERNARKHTDFDVDATAASIEEFGFKDPIAIWSDQNIIVEGHGRLLAAKKLGLKEVPVIRIDDLNDDERKGYGLAHNKTAENSSWDFDKLDDELEMLGALFDMQKFGFAIVGNDETENPYTTKVEIPQYEPTDTSVMLNECYDKSKYDELKDEISKAQITYDERLFLELAAARHLVFQYKKIADYYANKASPEMQRLMEKSALVIIDYDNAIANGYVKMSSNLKGQREEDYA